MAEKRKQPPYLKFIFGGTAGMMATSIVQPLDLVKTRMQVAGTAGRQAALGSIVVGVVKNEGIFGFYNGLSAALLRQATYTTTRLGTYNVLEEFCKSDDGKPPSFIMKFGIGMAAGGCGAFVGTPAEVALIRMTADGRLPVAERRNYKNVVDALARIVREEGVVTLWRGAVPTIARAMVVNSAQLATYSQAKQKLMETGYFKEDILLHFCSSMISGLATTIASMPVDIIKTRIQNMKMINGKPEYSGIGEVFLKIIRNEGILALWKGFLPYLARLGPHTVLTFIFLEQLNKAYQRRAPQLLISSIQEIDQRNNASNAKIETIDTIENIKHVDNEERQKTNKFVR